MKPRPLALVRLWFSEHDVIGILALVALMLGLADGAYFFPLEPPEDVVGVVQRVTLGASKNAYNRAAFVRLGSQEVVDVAPNTCAAGDSIHLVRQRRLWGYAMTAGPFSCSPPAHSTVPRP